MPRLLFKAVDADFVPAEIRGDITRTLDWGSRILRLPSPPDLKWYTPLLTDNPALIGQAALDTAFRLLGEPQGGDVLSDDGRDVWGRVYRAEPRTVWLSALLSDSQMRKTSLHELRHTWQYADFDHRMRGNAIAVCEYDADCWASTAARLLESVEAAPEPERLLASYLSYAATYHRAEREGDRKTLAWLNDLVFECGEPLVLARFLTADEVIRQDWLDDSQG